MIFVLLRNLDAICNRKPVTAVGAIMTPVSREVFRKNKELRDFCIAQSAARRLGEPVDVAKVALFLASDDSAFVNGTGVLVDGGSSN